MDLRVLIRGRIKLAAAAGVAGVLTLPGCGLLLGALVSAGGVKTEVTPLPNGQYQIVVTGVIGSLERELDERWFQTAKERCADFEVVSKSLTPTAPNQFASVRGIIRCGGGS